MRFRVYALTRRRANTQTHSAGRMARNALASIYQEFVFGRPDDFSLAVDIDVFAL